MLLHVFFCSRRSSNRWHSVKNPRQCFRCLRMTETVSEESARLRFMCVLYGVLGAEVCEKYKHFLACAYTCQRQTRTM